MEQHIRCYVSRTGESTVLSSCPCTCHVGPPALNEQRDWGQHNGIDCDLWVSTQFLLESRQVDRYRRLGSVEQQQRIVGEVYLSITPDSSRWSSVGHGPVTWE